MANERVYCAYFGIKPEHILVNATVEADMSVTADDPTKGSNLRDGGSFGDPDPTMPKHFVLVDPSRKAVVLAIRGTASIEDALTDCQCRGAPFLTGLAHEKFAAFAKSIVDRTYGRIVKYIKANDIHQVILTGHSLGAGVASLAGLYLKFRQLKDKKLPEDIKIKCFPIATPSCFRRDPENSPAYGADFYIKANEALVEKDVDIATGIVAKESDDDYVLKKEAIEYMFVNTHNFILENDAITQVGTAAAAGMFYQYKELKNVPGWSKPTETKSETTGGGAQGFGDSGGMFGKMNSMMNQAAVEGKAKAEAAARMAQMTSVKAKNI